MTILTLIETARANDADPYFYLKYLMEQMPKHLYDKGCEYMPDLMPWSDAYRQYESSERLNQVRAQAPPGNERPRTPKKRKPITQGIEEKRMPRGEILPRRFLIFTKTSII